MKKALIVSNQGLSTLHLGIELEVIEKIASDFDEVVYTTCDSATLSCYFNPTGNPVGCAICQARNIKFHQLLPIKNLKHVPFPKEQIDELAREIINNNKVPIENWSVNGVNIGRGILSSVISLKRDYNVYDENVKPLINEELNVALKAIKGFEKLCNLVEPDEVFLFNGRFSETYPIVSYCKFHGKSFNTLEVGSTTQKFEMYKNQLPHSIKARKDNMWTLWKNAPDSKYKTADKWFTDKIQGLHKEDKNYTENQQKSLLPDNFNRNKINISIFNSSEDEMKAIEEWQHDIYSTQNEAIRTIVEHFLPDQKIHFYLRMHPNLANLNNTQVNDALNLQYNNLTIIPSSDPIDTYALIDNSDIIISFGSTVGIEATYKNKISIMLGKSFYSDMNAVFEPKSFDEVYNLIDSFYNLVPKPKENTLPYAYYVSNRGEDFKHLKYENKYNSYYRNVKMNRFYISTLLNSFIYFFNIRHFIQKFLKLYGRWPMPWDLKKLKY